MNAIGEQDHRYIAFEIHPERRTRKTEMAYGLFGKKTAATRRRR